MKWVRRLLAPVLACRAATIGDPVGWCDRPDCFYGTINAVHLEVRDRRAFLTVQCRRCHRETVLPWLTRADDGHWYDRHNRYCPTDPTSLTLPSCAGVGC